MDWRQFVMDLETLHREIVEDVLLRHGAAAITLSNAGETPVLEPAPGETPLWPAMRITGLFSGAADFDALRSDLCQALGISALPPNQVTDLQDRDWEREWMRDFGPMRFGSRLWICPGDAVASDSNAIVVRLDPGLAFGTGTHATTALCLEWLDSLDLDNKTILDYGSGSGVLAIAALLLGCSHALAMDIDPQAIIATRANAARNQVGDRLSLVDGPRQVHGTFDVVVANILAGPLVQFAESIAAHVAGGCVLALSGILSEQIDEVLSAYRPWIEFDEPTYRQQGGQIWARLTGRRIEG
ncbi:MAG: 50S ribosomal protein L11 methyltransferase [Gammaproteobacteria bacterium]|nr:50S ribosomal protein L11 methyltransferase [Gammaproteobacteria bacterium]MDH5321934.1 50S ribosomal protein L11 methyltransferase [Gammaproteobacteria bacterium]